MTIQLNLGSGIKPLEGYCNLDKFYDCDLQHDLNNYPYPFLDNSVKKIIAENILEHLDDLPKTLKEIHRICLVGADIYIEVPYYKSYNSYQDPTHKQYFTWNTIDYFCDTYQTGDFPCLFEVKEKWLQWRYSRKWYIKPFCWIGNKLINICPRTIEKHFSWIFSIMAPETIKYNLKVIKDKQIKEEAEK